MHCFNHAGHAAVGLCKECGKGLCPNCLTDLGHGLACKGVHEAEVQAFHAYKKAYDSASRSTATDIYATPVFFLVLGLLFLGWGFYSAGLFGLVTLMGVSFFVYAVIIYRANKKAAAISS